ncbi:MAG: HD domain-containing protein [Proteobacteria bacterium]|nr:HD domain-containing protein [Pseudomonadota bacterium]
MLSNKSLVDRARAFALTANGGRPRECNGIICAGHLDAVALLLERSGISSPEIVAAAYLHDIVQDTPTTYDDIIKTFGTDICQLVYWLTDDENENRKMRSLLSAWRLARAPWNAKLIKLADIIDTSSSIREGDDADFAKLVLDENRQILRLMAEAEGAKLMHIKLFQQAVALTDTAQR